MIDACFGFLWLQFVVSAKDILQKVGVDEGFGERWNKFERCMSTLHACLHENICNQDGGDKNLLFCMFQDSNL